MSILAAYSCTKIRHLMQNNFLNFIIQTGSIQTISSEYVIGTRSQHNWMQCRCMHSNSCNHPLQHGVLELESHPCGHTPQKNHPCNLQKGLSLQVWHSRSHSSSQLHQQIPFPSRCGWSYQTYQSCGYPMFPYHRAVEEKGYE